MEKFLNKMYEGVTIAVLILWLRANRCCVRVSVVTVESNKPSRCPITSLLGIVTDMLGCAAQARVRPTICTRKKNMSPDAPNGSQRKGSYSDCRSVSQGVFLKPFAKLKIIRIEHQDAQ
jgi:hypothetical protein